MTPDLELATSAEPRTRRVPQYAPPAGVMVRALEPALETASERVSYRETTESSEAVPRAESLAVRALNVALAAFALVLLAPLFVAIAVAIKATSPGPVFYLQPRVGLDRRGRQGSRRYDRRTRDLGGRIFTIYKFRSMRDDAERDCGAVWATQSDLRVTAIGRVLRSTRLDELPQLINVVLGDMNIVGPRPERPSIFARLREDIAEYPLRQLARPGITGLAQISQSYDSCVDDVRRKVRFDLEYLERRSVREDLRIMVKTVPVMLFHRGGW